MNSIPDNSDSNKLLKAAADGTLVKKLKRYLSSCRATAGDDPKKEPARLPTLAGFCAQFESGLSAATELKKLYPAQYDYLRAALEDEALNSMRAPALLNTYLKERLCYGEKPEEPPLEECMRLIFEHDITADGA